MLIFSLITNHTLSGTQKSVGSMRNDGGSWRLHRSVSLSSNVYVRFIISIISDIMLTFLPIGLVLGVCQRDLTFARHCCRHSSH